MDKLYQHQLFEKDIYSLWQKNECFNPDKKFNKKSTGKSFCIIMPPPNANDPLHVGHAVFVSIEDVLIRYHRMLGDDVLWLPGTDHAGIETQFVFEKKLKKENKSRFNFDRETLYQMIWDYVKDNSNIAINQIKNLGASADWNRFKFTLDKDIVKTVLKTFEKMSQDKLVYRDNRLVNYCTKCGTAFSNLEVVHKTQTSPLYYIKYGPLTLATTRPETKFADTAVAVHPKDKRYKKYIGKEIDVEGLLGNFKLKVIADEFVDQKFGTGVVKITPYHDFDDFGVWQKHKDEIPEPKTVIDFNGRLTEVAGKYAGMKVLIAREQIAKDMAEKGILVKIDRNYQNNIGTCYRCGSALEPLPLPQFYIKVKPLTKPIIEKLNTKKIKIYGSGRDKILLHWLRNLEDWNISRQIVWGIRLPVWYEIIKKSLIKIVFIDKKGDRVAGEINEILSRKNYDLAEIKKGLQNINAPINNPYVISQTCPGENFIQETDTFDTWFSSSQWPFVTLLNAKENDFKRFYPTSIMETGYDILPFWVMRMLMVGFYQTQKLPFDKVYLHGLIRDSKGQKMSKSKGNVIDPMEISQKYGSDALRMALIIRSTAGLDKSVGETDFKAMRNLTNKLWNASRFILLNQKEECAVGQKDKNFEKKMLQITKQITKNLNNLQIGLAAETLYNEFWHWFCDVCIEDSKNNKLSQEKLLNGLKTFLKLFHPFIPFVTETIWQELKKQKLVNGNLLIVEDWPN